MQAYTIRSRGYTAQRRLSVQLAQQSIQLITLLTGNSSLWITAE